MINNEQTLYRHRYVKENSEKKMEGKTKKDENIEKKNSDPFHGALLTF